MQFSHDAMCPEISPVDCADPNVNIIHHEHHQSVLLTRLQPSLSVGMGRGWQAMLRTPFDIKKMGIEYTDTAGNPYKPPYGNIHHRNEVLLGPGDSEFELQRYWATGQGWIVGGGIGSMIPIGRTEEDPYIRASQSLTHQHMQMGGGTFDPIMSATAVWGGHQWGMSMQGKGRIGLYENKKNYKSSSFAQIGAGPTYRFTSKLMFTSDVTAQHDWQAQWAGEPDPMSGRTILMVGTSLIHRFNPYVAMMGQTRITIFQVSTENQILQRFVGSLGISVTPRGNTE